MATFELVNGVLELVDNKGSEAVREPVGNMGDGPRQGDKKAEKLRSRARNEAKDYVLTPFAPFGIEPLPRKRRKRRKKNLFPLVVEPPPRKSRKRRKKKNAAGGSRRKRLPG